MHSSNKYVLSNNLGKLYWKQGRNHRSPGGGRSLVETTAPHSRRGSTGCSVRTAEGSPSHGRRSGKGFWRKSHLSQAQKEKWESGKRGKRGEWGERSEASSKNQRKLRVNVKWKERDVSTEAGGIWGKGLVNHTEESGLHPGGSRESWRVLTARWLGCSVEKTWGKSKTDGRENT